MEMVVINMEMDIGYNNKKYEFEQSFINQLLIYILILYKQKNLMPIYEFVKLFFFLRLKIIQYLVKVQIK